jgi:hypothetical protein
VSDLSADPRRVRNWLERENGRCIEHDDLQSGTDGARRHRSRQQFDRSEGLWGRIEARQAGSPLAGDDPDIPILLAMSDNGPQMRAGTTREFLALCSIVAHFGRPGTPTDQA